MPSFWGRKKGNATRDKPATVGFLTSDAAFETLCVSGFTRLADNPEVVMATTRIADLISSMTIHLMENGENGDTRIQNELSRKLDIEPSADLTRMSFMTALLSTLLIENTTNPGNAVVYPHIKDGLIDDLQLLEPSRTAFEPHGRSYLVRYNDRTFAPNEVLHFTLNPDPERPWYGRGYRVVLRDVVENLSQAAATKKGFMADKWKPSVIVRVESNADEMASEAGRDTLLDKYIKTSEAGKPWVIPAEMMDVQQVKPLTLNDLAINDSVQLDKKTVAGIFGVPHYVVGAGPFDRNEWNNFISATIMPLCRRIEQELTRKLLISPSWYFRMNPRALYSYELKDMAGMAMDLYIRGLRTGNEVRDVVGDSPMQGLDELVILENFIPVGSIGDQKKLNGGEKGE